MLTCPLPTALRLVLPESESKSEEYGERESEEHDDEDCVEDDVALRFFLDIRQACR